MRKILFAGSLRITLVFAIHTVAPLISKSLPGNTPVNGYSLKVSEYLSLFLYLVLIFVVSHVIYYIFMSPTVLKMIPDAVYLISSA